MARPRAGRTGVRIATLGNAAAIHTQRWVEYFRGRGHQVGVWSLESGPAALEASGLASLPLPRALRYPCATPALARALRGFVPDLVDAHFVPNYGLLGALVGRHPLSVTAWGSDLLLATGRDPWRRARARFVLERADLVLADAENLASAARELGAEESRVHCVPWGADLERFRPASAREPGLILSVRMHEPIYDLATVIEGAAPVLASRPECRLVIAGSGSLTPALTRLAARHLPPGRVQWVGMLGRAELAAWLGKAAVVVSASRSDSTSISLLEAMAAGAIPVVSDLAGNREWVQDGDGARLFAVGDPAGLARAVEQVLGDPEWAEGARARNRSVVEARGDHARNMARIERLFEELVSRS